MKQSILLFGLFFGALFVSPTKSDAQWQPDVRLTNDPAVSFAPLNNARCIASSGASGAMHVVWYDNRDVNYEIYYKRSTDGGLTWGADTRLTNNTFDSKFPSVSVSGQAVHVAWMDRRDGNYEIYYKRSTDGGVSWGSDTRLTNNVFTSNVPSVIVSGASGAVHVVWDDARDGNSEIYYKRSTDGGISWGPDTRLTSSAAFSSSPSVTVSGAMHVVWHDERDGNWEIYYKRSTDEGVSWGTDTRLTNDTSASGYPSVTLSGSAMHVVWYDDRDGNNEIYYKRSTDEGVSWEADTRLTNDSAFSWYPSVTASGSTVHVVWYDNRDGNYEIYYKRSTDGGVSWGGDIRLTINSAGSFDPSVSVSGSAVHVVWWDQRDGNTEIYYKRDPAGNPTEVDITNSEIPGEFKLHQNFPNPFNPTTRIDYALPYASHVRLTVYNLLGQLVATLVDEERLAGRFVVEWNGRGMNGNGLSSGVYFYTLATNDFVQTKRLMLLK